MSVYDKAGLDDLVRGLHEAGVELVSTGGSAALIESLGLPVTKVEDLTGFPECLDGRVKTLHPRVHAGILADRRLESHVAQLEELGVEPFDLVVSNLYPFTQTVASGASPDECVEQIDIGGPSMVRAAAKNHPSVAIVTSPAAYDAVLAAVAAGGFTLAERQRLAAEAFVHTATYDVHVASWMGNVLTDTSEGSGFPAWMGATWDKAGGAALRREPAPGGRALRQRLPARGPGLAQATQHHGKEMSYNNYVDADAARRAAYDFDEPAVAIIKHANPCGIAVGADVAEAHRKAHECDPVSAFGGVIATNVPGLGGDGRARSPRSSPRWSSPPATRTVRSRRCRRRRTSGSSSARRWRAAASRCAPISGGLLRAGARRDLAPRSRRRRRPGHLDPRDRRGRLRRGAGRPRLRLARLPLGEVQRDPARRRTAPRSASGMGQVNRVDSCRLAVERAGERAASAVAASDAFFPFADGPQILIDAGVKAIVQPGGSVRDAEVVAACEAAGVTMYLTGTRHFFH